MTDNTIIEKIEAAGISYERLSSALNAGDNWGGMVNAFEYLTVLGIVAAAMKPAVANQMDVWHTEKASRGKTLCGIDLAGVYASGKTQPKDPEKWCARCQELDG